MTTPSGTEFWVALLQIIGIDIILSGDNAVVIALACRSLPAEQQRWGIALGTAGAIVMRVVFATFIIYLFAVPYLKVAGSLLLLWIAVSLLLPEKPRRGSGVAARATLAGAVRTIIVADAVMSLDNVVGIAAAAKGSLLLLALGLLISIPIIVFSSTLILKLLGRFPVIVTLGAGLLGWVAGDIGMSEPAIARWSEAHAPLLPEVAPVATAVLVVLAGTLIARRRQPGAARDLPLD